MEQKNNTGENSQIPGVNVSNTRLNDWRIDFPSPKRQIVISHIVQNIKNRFKGPVAQPPLAEIQSLALRLEEKVFKAARTKEDYLQTISRRLMAHYGNRSNNPADATSSCNSPDPGMAARSNVNSKNSNLTGNSLNPQIVQSVSNPSLPHQHFSSQPISKQTGPQQTRGSLQHSADTPRETIVHNRQSLQQLQQPPLHQQRPQQEQGVVKRNVAQVAQPQAQQQWPRVQLPGVSGLRQHISHILPSQDQSNRPTESINQPRKRQLPAPPCMRQNFSKPLSNQAQEQTCNDLPHPPRKRLGTSAQPVSALNSSSARQNFTDSLPHGERPSRCAQLQPPRELVGHPRPPQKQSHQLVILSTLPQQSETHATPPQLKQQSLGHSRPTLEQPSQLVLFSRQPQQLEAHATPPQLQHNTVAHSQSRLLQRPNSNVPSGPLNFTTLQRHQDPGPSDTQPENGTTSSSSSHQRSAATEQCREEILNEMKLLKNKYSAPLQTLYKKLEATLKEANKLPPSDLKSSHIERYRDYQTKITGYTKFLDRPKHMISPKDREALLHWETVITTMYQTLSRLCTSANPPCIQIQETQPDPSPPTNSTTVENLPSNDHLISIAGEDFPSFGRLIEAINNASSTTLLSSMREMAAMVTLEDAMHVKHSCGRRSASALGADLAAEIKQSSKAEDDGIGVRWERMMLKREEGESLSLSLNLMKRLVREAEEVNQRLIDTTVEVGTSGCGLDGAVAVSCRFIGVSVGWCRGGGNVLIAPLRITVPPGYPECASAEVVAEECGVLTGRARLRLRAALEAETERALGGGAGVTVAEIARAWEECSRGAVRELTRSMGGGCFSDKYGSWETIASTK